MKLKTLINILRSSGKVEIFWKDREELLSHIQHIHSCFEDSTDPMNNPVVITDFILNEMSDKVKIYQRQVYETAFGVRPEVELMKRDPKDNLELINTLKQIIENRNIEENKKDGSFFIDLTSDILYELFSLEEWRQKQLNKIV